MTAPAARSRRAVRRQLTILTVLAAFLIAVWGGPPLWHLAQRHPNQVTLFVVTLVLVLVLAVSVTVGHARWQQRTETERAVAITELDAMNSREFEDAITWLALRDGCTAERVGGAGDLGADVIGKLPGRNWWQPWMPPRPAYVIQCKRYGSGTKVSSGDVQKVGGTWRTIHHADVAIVVTTSHFTKAAADYCRRAGILTCDRGELAAWASGTGPAPWE